MASVERVFRALDAAGVRYVVVGGLATVLHGHARFTMDVDLVVDLAPEPARRAVDALVELGFEPRVPVAARDFADPEVRQRWIRLKRQAGRPQDLDDVRHLEEILRRREGEP